MTKLVVTVCWRRGSVTGQLYLLDLSKKKVLDFICPDPPEPHGGTGGFRGCFVRDGKAFVLDTSSLRVFDVEHGRLDYLQGYDSPHVGLTEVLPNDDGSFWCGTIGSAGVARMALPDSGQQLQELEFWEAWDPVLEVSEKPETDQLHINGVARIEKQMWTFPAYRGRIVRFRPAPPRVMSTVNAPYGHSLKNTPRGTLLLLDTKASEVIHLAPDGNGGHGEVLEKVAIKVPSPPTVTDETTGRTATSGYLRGCCVIDEKMAIVGAAPAQLMVVDYVNGRVIDRWEFGHGDVGESVYAITGAGE